MSLPLGFRSFSRAPRATRGLATWVWTAAQVIGVWLAAAPAAAQESFPYEATVATSSAVVHAAPTDRAYATAMLSRGMRVEVYRQDPGGWCAIRPPQGSFSLVARDALRPTSDPQVAELSRESVKAWVGTRISHRGEPLWQVKLAEGELVELLLPWPDRNADDEWLLVAPPAGEFRWVHERELRREAAPSTVVVPHAPQPTTPIVANTTPVRAVENGAPRGDGWTGTAASTPAQREGNSATTGPTSTGAASTSSAAADRPTPRNVAPGNASPDNATREDVAPRDVPPTADPGSSTATDFPAALGAAQRAFDRLLTAREPASEQQLSALLTQLSTLANGAADREQATQLADRFDRWRDLELRRRALDRMAQREPGRLAADPSSITPLDAITNPSGGFGEAPAVADGGGRWRSRGETVDPLTAPVSATDSPYAASGTLSRLIRTGGLASSSYALQDERGRVVALVVPTAGLNLERYLKKDVGVVGASSRNPTLGLPTVVAERVIELDRHR